jgi:hypothetical protein
MNFESLVDHISQVQDVLQAQAAHAVNYIQRNHLSQSSVKDDSNWRMHPPIWRSGVHCPKGSFFRLNFWCLLLPTKTDYDTHN